MDDGKCAPAHEAVAFNIFEVLGLNCAQEDTRAEEDSELGGGVKTMPVCACKKELVIGRDFLTNFLNENRHRVPRTSNQGRTNLERRETHGVHCIPGEPVARMSTKLVVQNSERDKRNAGTQRLSTIARRQHPAQRHESPPEANS